ncbi:Methyl-accepting chemotaxis protein [Granulibacter bethesdensis]|uniref:Methyl-accepting chemotaxis protein n=1 Tax=Granulibacter bethesdensis TaxID=364410 RepID=A0AAN0RF59_9PROT|nr:polyhydroxyalkanoate synthesis repressor PhaR [Granulibacter bethesdensis]AHJ63884.1 Methyl-accepting chemotaxis protein [Granulibacter bethesdensis]AHJ65535.1 Methyl-accepting chemotaxis protein [Granulibacter bethesdensis CGDNIH4]
MSMPNPRPASSRAAGRPSRSVKNASMHHVAQANGEAAPDQDDSQDDSHGAPPPVIIKKYANRRLYNTETSCYITLENLADMVRTGREFSVFDAKSGEDITRSVLTQIIVDEENKGRAMLPTTFLRQLIGFYGDSLQSIVPRYLEEAMSTFAHQQQQMRSAVQHTMGSFFPFASSSTLEEVSRQNMAMIEKAMSLFNPFYKGPETPVSEKQEERFSADQEIIQLKEEIKALKDQLKKAQSNFK